MSGISKTDMYNASIKLQETQNKLFWQNQAFILVVLALIIGNFDNIPDALLPITLMFLSAILFYFTHAQIKHRLYLEYYSFIISTLEDNIHCYKSQSPTRIVIDTFNNVREGPDNIHWNAGVLDWWLIKNLAKSSSAKLNIWVLLIFAILLFVAGVYLQILQLFN